MSTTTDQSHIARARLWLTAHAYKLTPGMEDIEIAGLLAATEIERDARHEIGGNFPPPDARINPERLIDVAALPMLLEANYQPLLERGTELQKSAEAWLIDHLVPRPANWPEGKAWPVKYAIRSEEDNGNTSDFLKQLADFAGGRTLASGEVDETRQKVKKSVIDAGKSIDGWFNGKRARHREIGEIADVAQTAFLDEKRREQARERQRLADEAAERARLALEAAKVAKGADDAVEAAVHAQDVAEVAAVRAAAPVTDMVRSTSMGGTTTTLATNWTWKLVNKGAFILAAAAPLVQRLLWSIPAIATNPELQKAISAALKLDEPDAMVSLDLVMENGPALTQATRGKGGRRIIPGIEITDITRASRR